MSSFHSQGRAEVAVAGQNGQVSGDGAADDLFHVSFKEKAVGGSDMQWKCLHSGPPLQLLGLFKNIVDGSCEKEAALGEVVALAVQDHLEAAEGLL